MESAFPRRTKESYRPHDNLQRAEAVRTHDLVLFFSYYLQYNNAHK